MFYQQATRREWEECERDSGCQQINKKKRQRWGRRIYLVVWSHTYKPLQWNWEFLLHILFFSSIYAPNCNWWCAKLTFTFCKLCWRTQRNKHILTITKFKSNKKKLFLHYHKYPCHFIRYFGIAICLFEQWRTHSLLDESFSTILVNQNSSINFRFDEKLFTFFLRELYVIIIINTKTNNII